MSIKAACEGFAFGKVRGWAFDKKAKERRLSVSFFVDDQFVGATTGEIHRDDLEAAGFGDGCFGAELEVPSQLLDGESHKVEMVVEGDLKVACEEAQVFDPMSVSPDFLVEHLDSRGAAGWAYQRVSGEEVEITLSSRQGVIAAGVADIRRNDVSSPAPNAQRQQRNGFRVPIPLAKLSNEPEDLTLKFSAEGGAPIEISNTAWLDRPRALIVSDAEDPADGSRFYRGELLAAQLRVAGVVCDIMGKQQAAEALAEGELHPPSYGIVVFLRCPLNEGTQSLLHAFREAHSLVLADVDDLNFKPWVAEEIGAVRSGHTANDEALQHSLRARLNMLQACDAVLCSTQALRRELRSLGLSAIHSPNLIEDSVFQKGALRLSAERPAGGLRILCASGTPTHSADLREIRHQLATFLEQHPDCFLTLLGDLRAGGLASLPNVRIVDRTHREEMFAEIARHDVLLVPLQRTRFNLSKSSLKFLEAAAVGTPVLATDLYEFRHHIRESEGGWLAKTPQAIIEKLSELAKNPESTIAHGQRAFQYAFQNNSTKSRATSLWDKITEQEGELRR